MRWRKAPKETEGTIRGAGLRLREVGPMTWDPDPQFFQVLWYFISLPVRLLITGIKVIAGFIQRRL